ncbi:Gfo/Idh/MocA family oxidoreductase [Salinicoccus sesuvii]|uniref:Gfo/Idh/MocA family oxidoreductase n=1 Tax=Salinicoccus sesuvii TaxID=868281 RepID=A0ABV7N3W4_9STAP
MDTIKIGVAGLGRLGLIHAENISVMKGVELFAICNLDADFNREIAERLDVRYNYTEYEEMIKNPELDAVCIATPSGLHTKQIELALEKGLHVFCEKPIGLDTADIERTIEKIDSHKDMVFHLGFMRRYDPDYLYAKQLVDAGEIGDISIIRSYGIDPISGLEGFVKFAKKSPSGGIFLDMGVHDIDAIRWITGSEVSKVWANGSNKAAPELDEVNELELGTATMQLENGVTAFVVLGRTASHGYHVEAEIIGTKGMLRIAATPEKNKVTLFNEHGVVRPTSQNFPERFKEAYIGEMRDFLDCIRQNIQPEVTALDGLRGTQVAIACQESLEKDSVVEVTY